MRLAGLQCVGFDRHQTKGQETPITSTIAHLEYRVGTSGIDRSTAATLQHNKWTCAA